MKPWNDEIKCPAGHLKIFEKLTIVFQKYQLISDNFYILEFIMTMNFHMAYVQYAITALIALNRFSIICNYLFFEPVRI